MTRREGLLPSGRRLLPPAKGTQCASGWTGPTPPPAPAAGLARPAAKGLDPRGAIPLGGLEGEGGTCDSGGLEYAAQADAVH